MRVDFDLGFPRLSLEDVATVDAPLAEKLKAADKNGDGVVQVRELVDAQDPALARDYMKAAEQLLGKDAVARPDRASAQRAADRGVQVIGGAAAFGLTATLFGDPTISMAAQLAAVWLGGSFVRPTLRDAAEARTARLRDESPEHQALDALLAAADR